MLANTRIQTTEDSWQGPNTAASTFQIATGSGQFMYQMQVSRKCLGSRSILKVKGQTNQIDRGWIYNMIVSFLRQ